VADLQPTQAHKAVASFTEFSTVKDKAILATSFGNGLPRLDNVVSAHPYPYPLISNNDTASLPNLGATMDAYQDMGVPVALVEKDRAPMHHAFGRDESVAAYLRCDGH
jgi:hypothetical protein